MSNHWSAPPTLASLLRKRKLDSVEPSHAGATPLASTTHVQLLGLRGLVNLGQTCFMSCILQIMLHCPPVKRFFLADKHNRLQCALRRRNTALARAGEGDTAREACLACEMDTLFSSFFSGEQGPYSPHSFLHAVWCWSERFASYEQQDAHEFLIVLLAGIYESVGVPSAETMAWHDATNGRWPRACAARTRG